MVMAILKIARMGHPVLRRVAEPVGDPSGADIQQLVADMVETLHDINGAGLAAPQVHVSRRVVIFHLAEGRASGAEGDVPMGMTVLINPEIEPLGPEMDLGWEGCLSVPGMLGQVPRFTRIRYRALTPSGESIERVASGFHARVVQHECDHLDGVLYPMRMVDLSQLGFAEEMRKSMRELADVDED